MIGGRKDIPFALLAERTGARFDAVEDALLVGMLGQQYTVRKGGVTLCGQKAPDTHVAVIRDYLRSAGGELVEVPWRSCSEFGAQYLAEFRGRIEQPLAQHARDLVGRGDDFFALFDARRTAALIGSDLAFTVNALPRVRLHLELSRESEDFPAEAWMLFSSNANTFLSMESLLQLGELCKERVLSLLRIY